jgi:hypothetical protein
MTAGCSTAEIRMRWRPARAGRYHAPYSALAIASLPLAVNTAR